MDAIYNYLLTNYSSKYIVKLKAHKDSELKSIYNRIVDINKKSPLYLVKLTDIKQIYAVDIKESAIQLGQELHSLSENDIDDTEAYLDQEKSFFEAYNSILEESQKYESETKQKDAPKLSNELRSMMKYYHSELEADGILFDEDGKVDFDDHLAYQSVQDGEVKKIFSEQSDFVKDFIGKSREMILNPMNYIDKTLVSYRNVAKPSDGYSYITSIYSGMMFNFYC